MAAAIFNGTAVKILKNILRFKSQVELITGDADDPTSVAKNAPQGSIYIRSGTNDVYTKQDSGSSTNWEKLADVSDISSFANKTLSNLTSPTSINQNLIPDGDNTRDLGTTTNSWQNLRLKGAIYAGTSLSVEPAIRILWDAASTASIRWQDRRLDDTTGNEAVQWQNRQLRSGTTVKLDWSGTDVSLNTRKLTSVSDPTAAQDVATKNYVDTNFVDNASVGVAGGVASLDGGGKVPLSQLPSAIMTYNGVWNASTNSPTLADGVGDTGDVYRVGTAGTQDLGSGSISFNVGDYVIYNGSTWEKSDTTDAVASVNGQTGVVSLDSDDIAEGVTNLYFSDERAQDAVGGILTDTTTIDLTYNDAGNQITADVKALSLTDAEISTTAAIAHSKMAALTASRAMVTDGSGVASTSAVTATELGYVSGVTSSIQTQLNSKIGYSLVSTSSNVNPAVANTIYLIDTTGGGVTVTLPATHSAQATIFLKDAGGVSNTNAITINPNGNQIDGSGSNRQIASNYGSITLVSNGTNWFIL